MKGKLIFSETQTFRYTWSWWLVLVITVGLGYVFGNGLYTQLILGEQWGDKPMSDTGLIIMNVSMGSMMLVIFTLIHTMKLKIEIDAANIYYHYFPFVMRKQTISAQDVDKIYVRKYNPIWEYGGWGYRIRPGSGRALNVAGKWGLQLELKNGKKLLLGTQMPQVMQDAINQLKANWEKS